MIEVRYRSEDEVCPSCRGDKICPGCGGSPQGGYLARFPIEQWCRECRLDGRCQRCGGRGFLLENIRHIEYWRYTDDVGVYANIPVYVERHGEGFEVGPFYSGAKNFALSILIHADAATDRAVTEILYRRFATELISKWRPSHGEIDITTVLAWVEINCPPDEALARRRAAW